MLSAAAADLIGRFSEERLSPFQACTSPRQLPSHGLSEAESLFASAHCTALQTPVVGGRINTSMGVMGLQADTPFILQDFYQAYKLPTTWPYCESTHKCLVYVQQDSPVVPKAPVTLTLPPGVAAIDLYIDAAIDCVKTLRAVVKCKAVVEPGNVEVKFSFSSICASPFVGKYLGFVDESGDSIESLQLRCKSTAPTALGLVRVGAKRQQHTVLDAAGDPQLNEQPHLQQQ